MLIRLVDENDRPVWVNAQHVRSVHQADPGVVCLRLDRDDLRAKGEAADVATQLQDALAGRKYVDFWSN
ncbi:MAG: hypothetical protein KC613_12165 [Myxococcales bacterium]|nr:hypothetical protein [Myxococcales bacterium]